jgi:hypothetical protein
LESSRGAPSDATVLSKSNTWSRALPTR